MKDDFIVAHLYDVCTFCRTHILHPQALYRFKVAPGAVAPKLLPERRFEGIRLEGTVIAPTGPVTSLILCGSCFEAEKARPGLGLASRLPAGVSPVDLAVEQVERVEQWVDLDPILESEFFETRQSFLSLCQGNHYQFDSLRRAKHSSMMVLYHMHNPCEPAFWATCNRCAREIEPGQGWRCTVCPDFDICENCKLALSQSHPHPHPLTRGMVDETRQRLTEEEQKKRAENLQRTMMLVVHACSCTGVNCQSTRCRKLKQLFQHTITCEKKVAGGCGTCKTIWTLLNLHARECTETDCRVPKCRELRSRSRQEANRQEEQRRQAYQAMSRVQVRG